MSLTSPSGGADAAGEWEEEAGSRPKPQTFPRRLGAGGCCLRLASPFLPSAGPLAGAKADLDMAYERARVSFSSEETSSSAIACKVDAEIGPLPLVMQTGL